MSAKPSKQKNDDTATGTIDPVALLPFVRDRSKKEMKANPDLWGRDFWAIRETEDWFLDCTLGKGLADRCVHQMIEGAGTYLLGWVVRDMINKGHFGGVECGFLARISELAKRGAVQ